MWSPKLRLAAPLVPFVFMTAYARAEIVSHLAGFFFGFAFFGQPLITRGAHWLTHKYPDWRKYLDLNKYVLRVVSHCAF